jgi:hypothetical protein
LFLDESASEDDLLSLFKQKKPRTTKKKEDDVIFEDDSEDDEPPVMKKNKRDVVVITDSDDEEEIFPSDDDADVEIIETPKTLKTTKKATPIADLVPPSAAARPPIDPSSLYSSAGLFIDRDGKNLVAFDSSVTEKGLLLYRDAGEFMMSENVRQDKQLILTKIKFFDHTRTAIMVVAFAKMGERVRVLSICTLYFSHFIFLSWPKPLKETSLASTISASSPSRGPTT